ncbi:MAG TPA: c-type cytochrome [Gammaproteobacteria bacterium]
MIRYAMPFSFARRLVTGGALLAACVAAPLAVGQDRSAPDPAIGKRLYYEHGCYGCHGFNGETGARDLVGTNSPIVADEQTFITFLRLRADQAPLLPSTRMPNYPVESLSDEDARHIYAYISSFELDAPEIDDVPVFKQILESAARPYTP